MSFVSRILHLFLSWFCSYYDVGKDWKIFYKEGNEIDMLKMIKNACLLEIFSGVLSKDFLSILLHCNLHFCSNCWTYFVVSLM
jgi:hypothetical protein